MNVNFIHIALVTWFSLVSPAKAIEKSCIQTFDKITMHNTGRGTYRPKSHVIWDGNLRDHELLFTFDDGPHPVYTRKILAVLKKYGVKAIFFQVGEKALKHPEITRAIFADGHVVGSHAFKHVRHNLLDLEDARLNITNGHNAVQMAAGQKLPNFFRYPFGAHTNELDAVVEGMGLISFFWSISPQDWDETDSERLLSKSLNLIRQKGRGIILLHDVEAVTANYLDKLLAQLYNENFRSVIFRGN